MRLYKVMYMLMLAYTVSAENKGKSGAVVFPQSKDKGDVEVFKPQGKEQISSRFLFKGLDELLGKGTSKCQQCRYGGLSYSDARYCCQRNYQACCYYYGDGDYYPYEDEYDTGYGYQKPGQCPIYTTTGYPSYPYGGSYYPINRATTYGNTYGNGYNPYYGTSYGTNYNTGYGTSYGTGYGTNYNTGYGTNYNTGYGTGYGTSYRPGYGTSYNTGYGTSYTPGYGTSYNTGYGTSYNTGYVGGNYPTYGTTYNNGIYPTYGTGYSTGYGTSYNPYYPNYQPSYGSCYNDYDCAGIQKCCSTGNSYTFTCQQPLYSKYKR